MEMREHKDCENRNDCKRAVKWSFANAVLYDQQRIEKKLTEMARKGWLIEEMHGALRHRRRLLSCAEHEKRTLRA